LCCVIVVSTERQTAKFFVKISANNNVSRSWCRRRRKTTNIMAVTAVLDCENLDSVLGFEILEHKPLPCERFDYSRLSPWLARHFQQPARVIAVVREGDGATRANRFKFAKALELVGVRVIFAERFAILNGVPVSREVVDHVVGHLLRRSSSEVVVVGSHDFYAAEPLVHVKERGSRVFAIGFPEFMSGEIISVVEDVFDLENEIGGFRGPLPRMQLV
jgi:putative heme uptake system protein